MTDEIYILKDDGQLEAMREQKFDLEDVLQQLVADHPELLSGQQIDPDNPRRWILVNREQGISDIIGGGNRWALDHLLIDQDAIPTLVEVKRSENSEIRRTIVGQMLDYAAHARHTWSAGDIRRVFEERTTSAGQDSNNVLAELLQTDEDPDADEFWQLVETNLRAARLRLLFVADGIPDELTRVVEFLNEQMPGIEVLAVEIKQFLGDSGQTLVPKVIGRTAATAVRSATSRSNSKQFNRARTVCKRMRTQTPTSLWQLVETKNSLTGCPVQMSGRQPIFSLKYRKAGMRPYLGVMPASPLGVTYHPGGPRLPLPGSILRG